MSKKEELEQIFEAGEELMQSAEYKKALTHFEKASEEHKSNFLIQYNIALCYFYLEKPKKVLSTLKTLLKYNAIFDRGHYLQARTLYFFMDNYQEAVTPALKAIELKNDNSLYYSQAALIFFAQKNYKRAIKLANDALNIDPDNYEAHLVLANYYYNEKQFELAYKHYLNAIENGHKYYDNLFLLNALHLEIAKTKEGYNIIKENFTHNSDSQEYKWLFKYSYMKNQPFNFPFLFIENFYIPKEYLFWTAIGFIGLIGLMYTFENLCIITIEAFKWFSSLIFIIYLPYQLLVYIFLNIYFNLSVQPKLTGKAC